MVLNIKTSGMLHFIEWWTVSDVSNDTSKLR